ncbi:hypothetical protein [Vibrio parahaemolyticus]|uniref:hypothetical protein n=1 Tax=Vibrio parahaemolyticus TaxID=670 RepID=UPI0006C12C68|nr:hypothetical protein ACX10_12275 [Vibrio parahaemolyticus]
MKSFFDGDRIKWIRFLIVFELLYILSEFALNAAILNAGGGLVVTQHGIDNLEKYGRLLSGVGLALLVFGFLGTKYSFRRRVFNFILTLVVCIPLMHKAQSLLIDDLIVGNATAETKSRAELFVTYKEGLISGDFGLGKEVPINRDNPTSAEELALFSMYSLMMFDSTRTEGLLTQDLNSWVSDIVRIRNSMKTDLLYDGYLQVSKEVDSQWKKYSSGQKELDANAQWENIYSKSAKEYANYKHKRDVEFPEYVETQIRKNNIHDLLYDQYEKAFSNGCGTNCRRKALGKVEAIMEKATGSKSNWQKWCDGNKCPGDEKFLAKQAVPLMDGMFSYMSGLNPDINSVSEFMNEPTVAMSIRSELADKGVHLPYGMTMNKANFIREFDKATGSASGVKTKTQFVALNEVQSGFKKLLGNAYSGSVPLGLSKAQFERKYVNGNLAAEVRSEVSKLKNSKRDFAPGGSRVEEGNGYLKMIIVPPIALFFSLFFSLFALARLPLRLLEISQIKNGANWKVKLKQYMTMLDLIVILSYPVLRSNSKFTSSSVIERFELMRGEKLEIQQVLGYKWLLGVEPVIYPIGMKLLNTFDLNNIDHPMYK